MSTNSIKSVEKTEVFYGPENTTNKVLQFMANAKKGWDTCVDQNGPSVAVGVEAIRRAVEDATTNRGVMVRAITEITKEKYSILQRVYENNN
jgi:hypothetical protein